MKVKSSVLFGLIVLTCLVGGISLIYRLTKEAEVWNPSDIYRSSLGNSRGVKCSTVSYASGSASDAPAVQLGASSTSRSRAVFSYAPVSGSAYSQSPMAGTASYSQSPIAYGQRLHTTSSAEIRSFGGGGNGGGVSMSGGAVQSSGSSVASSAGLSVSMPSTSVLAVNNTRNNSSVNDVMSSVSGDIAMASSQAYAGIGNTTKGVAGRKNAPGMGGNLDNWVQGLIGNRDYWSYNIDGVDYFDYAKLRELYNAAIANGDLPEGITWEEFLSWFGDQSSRYAFPIPSGVWFMCFLALGYGLYIAYRRKQKVVNS